MSFGIPKPVPKGGIRAPLSLNINSPNGTPGSAIDPNVIGTSSNFQMLFGNSQLVYPKGAEVALNTWSYNNSIFNITSEIGNNLIGYTNDPANPAATVWITLPNGNWGVQDISNYLQSVMTTNGVPAQSLIELSINTPTLQCYVYLGATPAYDLDLTEGTLWSYLGMNAPGIVETTGLLPNVVNIFTVSNVLLHCNLIAGYYSFLNNSASDVLYNSAITAKPGYFQTETPFVKQWFPINTSSPISEIVLYCSDQFGNQISFNGQPQSINLIFRYPREDGSSRPIPTHAAS